MPPKGRVIHHDDDDDEDDTQLFHTVRTDSKGVKRTSSITSTASRTASKGSALSRQSSTVTNTSNSSNKEESENKIHSTTSSQNANNKIDTTSSQNANNKIEICIIDLDGDDEVKEAIPSATEDSTVGKKRKRLMEDDDDFFLDNNQTNAEALQQDETFQKLLQLKQRVNQVKNKPQVEQLALATTSSSLSANVTLSKTNATAESTVVIPQVLTAAERQQRVEQKFAQQLQQQKNKTLQPASKDDDDRDEDEDDDAAITIKARLATANHEKKWKFNPEKPFEKLKAKIAKLYGVSPSLLVMKFDGEKLQDGDTLADAGIEDEDLLDVQITDKKALEKAMEALGSKRQK